MIKEGKDYNTISRTGRSKTEYGRQEFVGMPIPGNIHDSIEVMSKEQVRYNLIEINLVSLYNQDILNKLYEWSIDTEFYLLNRHLLSALINQDQDHQRKKKNFKNYIHSIKDISEKFDSIYVNGNPINVMKKQSHIIREGLKKQERAHFISVREDFMSDLEDLAHTLKAKQEQLDSEDMMSYFQAQLQKINEGLTFEEYSENKKELMKSGSCKSLSSNESQGFELVKSTSTKPHTIFSLSFQGKVKKVTKINIEKSWYIRTKNRYPLVLDFNFAKFIYKNDNQLSHELIAMSLIKYINRIISAETVNWPIMEYQIMPDSYGAFYEFVGDSMTISSVKKKYSGGIVEYLQLLEAKSFEDSSSQMSKVRKRFAQTYAGFCIAQYLLELKDRNNDNIMIRQDGSIFHIDLAFIFNASPGGMNFESAPFKFTKEYLSAMGGFQSDAFVYFESLLTSSLTKLTMNREEFLRKMAILSARKDQILCFKKFDLQKYKKKIPRKPQHVKRKVQELISDSYDSWRTKKYDQYQLNSNGIPE